MPRGTRSDTASRNEATPLVSSRRGKFVRLENLELEAEANDKLTKYKQYVYEAEGEEPTDGAICSAALEMLFAADAGFLQSLESQRKTGRNGAVERSGTGTSGEAGISAGSWAAGGDKRKKAEEQSAAAGG